MCTYIYIYIFKYVYIFICQTLERLKLTFSANPDKEFLFVPSKRCLRLMWGELICMDVFYLCIKYFI